MTQPDLRPDERELLATLLRARGREPGSFSAALQRDGLVRLSGPRGTAFYPRDTWLTRFSRHLDKAFFDAPVPPPSWPQRGRKGEATQE
ncbi:hypothetical protein PE066_17140 [Ramlibacter tataouinensis]|uniref:hypothetical protein n=1 Tax=Ramlibacter tataouinensis TaxID=94132 RepID=UPI0022F383FA|nr:hypothetical protein [Ramlibacter tataouinensis]WBY01170.1 hypothetical protein PE066_17140 [Ramlibacter tataouinensis]